MIESKSIQQGVVERIISNLRSGGFGATPVIKSSNENDWDIEKICVTKQGRDLCDINCQTGTISYLNSFDRDIVNGILDVVKNVRWEYELYSKSPNMEIEGLKKYKLLSQYNNVILAACEVPTLDNNIQKVSQFDYVTWEKDRAVESVYDGNYFGENYEAAREDFAKRSGLINADKLFSETEMLTIYSGLVKLQDLGDISSKQGRVIDAIKNKINNVLPEIDEKMYQASPQYWENKKYQERFSTLEPELEAADDNDYDQEY